MSETVHKVPKDWPAKAHIDAAKYKAMYAKSVEDPEAFWMDHGRRIDWIKPYSWAKRTSFAPGKVSIEWFGDGTTNVSLNCIDRHLKKRAKQTAIIWEGDDPKDTLHITYQQLHDEVCRLANVLKAHGVGSLRDHRQVDRNRIALFDAVRLEDIGKAADFVVQLLVGDVLGIFGIVAFPDDRGLLGAFFEVAIDAIERDVGRAVTEPFDGDLAGGERRALGPGVGLDPVNAAAMLGPERFRVFDRMVIHCFVFGFVDVRLG